MARMLRAVQYFTQGTQHPVPKLFGCQNVKG